MKIEVKKPKAIPFSDLESGDVFVWSGCSVGDQFFIRIETMGEGNAVELSTGHVIHCSLTEGVVKINGRFVLEKEDN